MALVVGVGRQWRPCRSAVAFAHTKHNYLSWCGKVGGLYLGSYLSSFLMCGKTTMEMKLAKLNGRRHASHFHQPKHHFDPLSLPLSLYSPSAIAPFRTHPHTLPPSLHKPWNERQQQDPPLGLPSGAAAPTAATYVATPDWGDVWEFVWRRRR